MIDRIVLSGFSRIPVHVPGKTTEFVGMLLVKKVCGRVTRGAAAGPNATRHVAHLVQPARLSQGLGLSAVGSARGTPGHQLCVGVSNSVALENG